jgi:hypothetical protein
VDTYDRDVIISEINSLGAPYVRGDYIVFTARADRRHVGAAFDFEGFRVIHTYERIDTRDIDGKVISSLYFLVMKIPDNTDTLAYRVITDGLWSADPLNPDGIWDADSSSTLSIVRVRRDPLPVTREIQKGLVRFVFRGRRGQKIQLSGTFTNWDPFIYEMRETSPGLYECDVRLLPGAHYYNFYTGLTPVVDAENPARAYTPDGRIVSMIQVH